MVGLGPAGPAALEDTCVRSFQRVNQLRNRIAHHEPLFTATILPSAVHKGIRAGLMLFAPAVHDHIFRTSKVAEVRADNPSTVGHSELDGSI